MYNLKISLITLLILTAVLYFHLQGMAEYLYVKYWYYDIMMHILGGAGIAMSAYCFAIFFNIECLKSKIWKIIILTFIAGVAWELFEVYYNIAGARLWTTAYYIDTTKDLIDDVIGSVIVYYLIRRQKVLQNIQIAGK